MATWVRQLTGTAPSATNADLSGTVSLDNATAPADFDPSAVSSVRVQVTIAVTAGTVSNDTHLAAFDYYFSTDSKATTIAIINGANDSIDSGTSSISCDETDSTIPTSLTQTQWENAELHPQNGDIWASWNKAAGPDGYTVEVTAVTVTITYTPSGASYDETGRAASVLVNTASSDSAGFSEARAALAVLSTASTDTFTGTYDETGRAALAVLATASTDTYTPVPSNTVVDMQTGRLKPGRWNWDPARLSSKVSRLIPNLVVCIPFWEGSGQPVDLITKTVGQSNSGGYDAGPLGMVLKSSTATDYTEFPHHPGFEIPTDEITVALVGYKYGAVQGWSNWLAKIQQGSPDKSWQLQQVSTTTGRLSFSVQTTTPTDLRAQPDSDLVSGDWYTSIGTYGTSPETGGRQISCRNFDAITGELFNEAIDTTTEDGDIDYDQSSLYMGAYNGSTMYAQITPSMILVFDRVLSLQEQQDLVDDPFALLRAASLLPLSTTNQYDETGRSAAIVASTASTDTAAITEAGAALAVLATANTAGISITESAAALLELNTLNANAVTITEAATATAILAGVASDSAAFLDSAAALAVLATDATDSSAMTESSAALVLLDVTSTAGTIYTDSGAALTTLATAATDSQGISEALSALVSVDSVETDQISITENLAASVQMSSQASDVVSITEAGTALTVFQTASTAGSFITENLTTLFTVAAVQTDSIAFLESGSALVELTTDSTDTYSGASSYDETGRTAIVLLAAVESDSAAFADTGVGLTTLSTTSSDQTAMVDSGTTLAVFNTASNAGISITESSTALATFAGVESDTASFAISATALTLVNTTATDVAAMTELTAALMDLDTASSAGISITESGTGLTLFAAIESESQTHVASGAALVNLISLSSDVLAMEDLRAALTLFQTTSTDTYTAGTINETGRSAQVIVTTAQSDALSATETTSALVLFAAVMTDSTVEHLTATTTLGAAATVYFIPDIAPGPGSTRSRSTKLPTAQGGGIPSARQTGGIPGVAGGSPPSKTTR